MPPRSATCSAYPTCPWSYASSRARNANELNAADVANETGIPVNSLNRLVGLLETLYLVQRVPAWSTNLTKRAVARPKSSLLATGLCARLTNISASGASPSATPEAAGHLLEGFIGGELRRQLGWAQESIRISHFRDRAGAEVDVILETPDGRIAGIEIKASSQVTRTDTKWLDQLRDKLGGTIHRRRGPLHRHHRGALR